MTDGTIQLCAGILVGIGLYVLLVLPIAQWAMQRWRRR